MRFIFVLILVFIHTISFGQFRLFDINTASENVVVKEVMSNKKNKKYVDTTRMRYEDGRIASVETIKNGKDIVTTSWEYEISDSVEIIKRIDKKVVSTIRKNYYNELGQLIKSDLYRANNIDSIISSQYDFKYNDNKVVSYKKSPMTFGSVPPTVIDVKVEYIDEYKTRKTLSYYASSRMNTHVSEIEYAKDMKSLISTDYMIVEYPNKKHYREMKRSYKSRNKSKNKWDEVIEENGKVIVKQGIMKIHFLLDEFGNWIGASSINKKGKINKLKNKVIIDYKQK